MGDPGNRFSDFPKKTIADALAYLERMEVEPTPLGVARWVDNSYEETGEIDHKYFRRMVDALIIICGGDPNVCYGLGKPS